MNGKQAKRIRAIGKKLFPEAPLKQEYARRTTINPFTKLPETQQIPLTFSYPANSFRPRYKQAKRNYLQVLHHAA